MLTIKNFIKRFNDRIIIEIPQYEFTTGIHWIKGENGSGKSTLFKSIAGILPFEGEILLADGTEIKKHPILFRSKINYGEAEPQYPGFLTAKDLIRFMGKVRGESLEGQDQYVRKFGIDQFFDKPCETYSSGMMKKLSLAMAFFGKPQVIILDEPLITLDEHARDTLFKLIRSKRQNDHISFLLSSHQSIHATELEVTQTFTIENKKLVPL
jgi:ABC-2 type transport system ATP-binding protein